MTQHIFVNRFYYPDISATSQILTDLASTLSDNGLQVVIVTSRSRYDNPSAKLPAAEQLGNVRVIRVGSTSFGRGRIILRMLDYLSFYLTMLWKLVWLVKPGDWIIAKTDPPLLSIPLLLVARLKRANMANWLQDVFPEVAVAAGVNFKSQWLQRLVMGSLSRLRNWSLKHSGFNVVLSEEMKDHIAKCGLSQTNLITVPNWADVSQVRPLPHGHNPLRSEWALVERFVVGYSGNMGIAHDLDAIVDAAIELKDCPEIVFLMIGSGFRKNFMIVDVQTHGLEEKVIFKSYQPRDALSYSLGCADVHIVSLRPAMEGLIVPSKFYGVCAAGRPTLYLGSKNSTISRIIKENRCGTTVSGGGAELASTIRNYLADAERCQREGHNARVKIAEKHTVDTAAATWQELFTTHSQN